MGHYDSCYEAEEDRRREQEKAAERFAHENTGLRFKAKIHAMSDEAAGEFRDTLLEICNISANMSGTTEQHKRMEILRKRIIE